MYAGPYSCGVLPHMWHNADGDDATLVKLQSLNCQKTPGTSVAVFNECLISYMLYHHLKKIC